MDIPDPEIVVRHIVRLLGGHDKAFQVLDTDFQVVKSRWEQDTGKIGRILRAHLFVEHFLTEHLQAKNPNLGSIDEARVTFAQKISLVDPSRPEVAYLLPGIRRLNIIRNRIAHSLHADVTKADANVFLQVELFKAMRNESAKRSRTLLSTDPIDIMEDFAIHAGNILHQSPMKLVWAEAIRLAQEESGQNK
jgi:hypothetical protein